MTTYTKTITLSVDGTEVRITTTAESPDVDSMIATIRQMRKIEKLLTQLNGFDN